jgi:hypothetical protein
LTGAEQVHPENVSRHQRDFLQFFDAGPPSVRNWLDAEGHVVGKVEDPQNPPASAARVQVYRNADGSGETYIGQPINRRTISLVELVRLTHCWTEPLWSLNDHGRASARAIRDEPLGINFKVPPATFYRFKAQADAEGRTMTAILSELVAAYLGGKL